jgi:Flp pilus assembly pilin Flp
MSERISLMLGRISTGLKREEGQGATEYAMVIGFLIVTLTLGIGFLGVGINNFLTDVANALPDVTP